jgi:hypothetical protein
MISERNLARPYWAVTSPLADPPLQWIWGRSQHTIVSGTSGRYLSWQAAPIAAEELQPRRETPSVSRYIPGLGLVPPMIK